MLPTEKGSPTVTSSPGAAHTPDEVPALDVSTPFSFGLHDIDGLSKDAILYGECDVGSLGLADASKDFFEVMDPLVIHLHKWASEWTAPAKIVVHSVDVNGTGAGVWNRGAVYSHNKEIFPFRVVGETADSWLTEVCGGQGGKPAQLHIHEPGNFGRRSGPTERDFDPAWFAKNAPKKVFFADERADERAAYMREAIATAGTEPEFDAAALTAAWDALRPELEEEPQPGATSAEIDAFTEATNTPMPSELRALLGLVNGCKRMFNGQMLSVEKMIRAWESWKRIFDDWSLAELEDFNADSHGVRGIYTNPRWIPLSDDHSGYTWYVDLVPTAGGRVGQVVSSGADDQSTILVASSLTELLQQEVPAQRRRKEKKVKAEEWKRKSDRKRADQDFALKRGSALMGGGSWRAKVIDKIDAVHLREIHGDRALLVAKDGSALLADSATSPEAHQQLFSNGQRTPIEDFPGSV